ncbi:hypothetical protein WJX74_002235 [Apatococcus lobatus]|uniref:N-acetyltransferase domain-containing protein n=1 Tax=Apatococcus lobatus TaxID=904363 RepID=A0AAW1R4I2_9CHLO
MLQVPKHVSSTSGFTSLRARRKAVLRVRLPCSARDARLELKIRTASTSSAELRSIGALRGTCFSSCPAGRSALAAQLHRRMMADNEWDSIEDKVHGKDVAFKGLTVVPIMATLKLEEGMPASLADALATEIGLQYQIPESSGYTAWCVGSLDLNIGARLPSEEVTGCLPGNELEAQRSRAYLSNVCVTPCMRKQGIAQDLIQHAKGEARGRGVAFLYVHVVPSNEAARNLYLASGFSVENQESVAFARSLNRLPREILLHEL